MAYGDFKHLTRRTVSDKIQRDKPFNIAKTLKCGYKRGLASILYKCLDKTTSALRANKFAGSDIKNENMSDQELAKELHKPIIIKFKKITITF